MIKSYPNKGYIESVYEAMEDFQSYDHQHSLRQRRNLVDPIAKSILFLHPEPREEIMTE